MSQPYCRHLSWVYFRLYSTNSEIGNIDITKWRTECNWQDYDSIDHLQHLEHNFAALDNTEYGMSIQYCLQFDHNCIIHLIEFYD